MKKLMLILGLISFIYTSIIYAASTVVPDDIPLKIEANISYTFNKSGWLFSDSLELKNRYKLLEYNFLEQSNALKDTVIADYKKELDIQQQITDKYKKAWEESEDKLTQSLAREGRSKVLYLIGGILLTVGAGLALGAAANAL